MQRDNRPVKRCGGALQCYREVGVNVSCSKHKLKMANREEATAVND